ncbi:ribonuclease III [Candidatus Daviesbacteria bacterium]|nr:ribonuclease III [Candidatus Daviesbacteria bacterium]
MGEGKFNKLLVSLGLKFDDSNLLKQAFIHRSYLNETKIKIQSNERLEFLGDTILSFVISNILYVKRPDDTEGDLTNLRSYIVKTPSLAKAAQQLGLGEYLFLSKGEDASGGRENPQLLANTYEALIGTIFIDKGLEAAKSFIEKTLLPLFEKEIHFGPPKDAKSQLQEVVQEKLKESPQYRVITTEGPDHAKEFTVGVFISGKNISKGKGSNKQEAEENAAANALKVLTTP